MVIVWRIQPRITFLIMHKFMTELTDPQLERYSRHILLDEIDWIGQARLLNGRVLVIGCGGLGSACIAAVWWFFI